MRPARLPVEVARDQPVGALGDARRLAPRTLLVRIEVQLEVRGLEREPARVGRRRRGQGAHLLVDVGVDRRARATARRRQRPPRARPRPSAGCASRRVTQARFRFRKTRSAVALGDLQQAIDAQRLAQVVDGAQRQRGVAHVAVARQDHDRDRREVGRLLQLLAQQPAVHLRHHHVQQDQAGAHVILQVLQRLAPAADARDAIALVDQDVGDGVTHVWIVVDDEDRAARKLGEAHRRLEEGNARA